MNKYLVITMDDCPYCDKVKGALTSAGREVIPVNLGDIPEIGDVLNKLGVKTVPQVFEYVGNCNETIERLGL